MKPEAMPHAEYDTRMADAKRLIEADPALIPMLRIMPQLVEIVAGSGVLWEQMLAAGADEDEATSLQQAHGQACFPSRDPWKTADALFIRWSKGRAPKPGLELADALLTGPSEDIADLPSGGMRIVKVAEGAVS